MFNKRPYQKIGLVVFFTLLVFATFIAYRVIEAGMNLSRAAMAGDNVAVRAHVYLTFPSDSTMARALVNAASRGHYETAKILLEAGADPNMAGPPIGGTPLELAAVEGHQRIADLLIESGAYYAVTHAVLLGRIGDVERFLHQEPTAIHEGLNGDSLLHLAVRAKQLSVLKLLLDRNMDLDSKNQIGDTPLELAKSLDHQEVASFLETRMNSSENEVAPQ